MPDCTRCQPSQPSRIGDRQFLRSQHHHRPAAAVDQSSVGQTLIHTIASFALTLRLARGAYDTPYAD